MLVVVMIVLVRVVVSGMLVVVMTVSGHKRPGVWRGVQLMLLLPPPAEAVYVVDFRVGEVVVGAAVASAAAVGAAVAVVAVLVVIEPTPPFLFAHIHGLIRLRAPQPSGAAAVGAVIVQVGAVCRMDVVGRGNAVLLLLLLLLLLVVVVSPGVVIVLWGRLVAGLCSSCRLRRRRDKDAAAAASAAQLPDVPERPPGRGAPQIPEGVLQQRRTGGRRGVVVVAPDGAAAGQLVNLVGQAAGEALLALGGRRAPRKEDAGTAEVLQKKKISRNMKSRHFVSFFIRDCSYKRCVFKK